MNTYFGQAAFALGAAALGWVAWGYLGSHPLALTMTLLIAAFYAMGGLELWRFRQATASLHQALASLPAGLAQLGPWLARLHPSLRNAVRLRIEGQRVALPGPVMTPYLVGLLVLLGMLGTFLGMVVTLNGAVMALETTTDLPTIRAALAAPVKGLGLAFGTSVAGVAASAMLGLVSALCRRERLQAAQALESHIGSTLRTFSDAHQRQATLDALQAQVQVLPQLVGQLQVLPDLVGQVQALMGLLARQGEDLNQRLLAGQDRFHAQTQTSYAELAASVDRSLQHSLIDGARMAGATLQPVAEATMAGIARETAALQARLADVVQQQLDGLASRFDGTVTTVAQTWTRALDQHQHSSETLASGLQVTLGSINRGFEQTAASLLAAIDERQAAAQRQQLATTAELARQTTGLHERMGETARQQVDGLAERFGATTGQLAERWQDTLARQQQGHEALSAGLQQSLAALVQGFEQQSASLLQTVAQGHADRQADTATSDQQRLAAWTGTLDAALATLQREWQQAGAQQLAQQQQICQTLERTASGIQARADVQARDTIAEMSRLIATASEAPRAAAEVVGLLREKLSDSLARDNGMLEERGRIMATLNTLLDAVNQAATDQRTAIDALVASSAAMLQQAGARFDERIEAESSKLAAAAAEASGSAIEVASLGEAFGAAVQQFGDSSQALVGQLQRIEAALAKSGARSDEQLAYYVAQAREIVDLSISSQRQIVDDLQQLAIRQQPLAGAQA